MCTPSILASIAFLVVGALLVGHALVAITARLDAWRETNLKRRLLDEAIERHLQAQNRWVDSPVVDVERRA